MNARDVRKLMKEARLENDRQVALARQKAEEHEAYMRSQWAVEYPGLLKNLLDFVQAEAGFGKGACRYYLYKMTEARHDYMKDRLVEDLKALGYMVSHDMTETSSSLYVRWT